MQFSKKDLIKLSSNNGLNKLLKNSKPDFQLALKELIYEEKLRSYHIELIKLQNWTLEKNKRILILFEGGEFSGKGNTINTIMRRLNPRSARMVALPTPTPLEKKQWYFKRYILQLPKPGEMTFFDRSWYNRAVVEPVNGFCTNKEYVQFMKSVNSFESMLYNDGVIIRKIFLSINKETQRSRIELVRNNPLRRWELSQVDENAQDNWDKYMEYESRMLSATHTKEVSWKKIDFNDPMKGRLEAIEYILDSIPFK